MEKRQKTPRIVPTAHVAPGAVVLGDVALGERASVWYNAVVRGDVERIAIGAGTNIQECAVIHADSGFPAVIGGGVTVGHGAIVHGCQIGDGTLIGMGAIILNGAKIGRGCIVGAGALVTQGAVIPDGVLALGSPARVRRPLTAQEMDANRRSAEHYAALSQSL